MIENILPKRKATISTVKYQSAMQPLARIKTTTAPSCSRVDGQNSLGQTTIIYTEVDKMNEKKIYENIYLDKNDISVNKQIDR